MLECFRLLLCEIFLLKESLNGGSREETSGQEGASDMRISGTAVHLVMNL